ncbi:MAG: CBS domain-containing protein [Bacteroidia bacterium]|nr:CBS domain-containing protein [Bacteroidia bacterium]MCZ2140888.1 CBS domain-containing protein [Bacteroidia bacterium]
MIAKDVITEQIIPLKRIDSCEAALELMIDTGVNELPVVEQGKLLGYINLKQIKKSVETSVAQLMSSTIIFIPEDTHLFDVLRIFQESGLSTIAVCDNEQQYIGAISIYSVLKSVALNVAHTQPGAIITLSILTNDYSLTELARIVESNNFKIVGVLISAVSSGVLEINLKINSSEVNSLLHALERYNYNIKSVHQLYETENNMQGRANWLIKYLNI